MWGLDTPRSGCQQHPRGPGWGGSARTGGQREAALEGCLGLRDLSFRTEKQEEEEEEGQERGEPVCNLASFPAKWVWQHSSHKAESGPR